jgi:diketogulonate reductase-like aldo/keto reductase
MDAPARTTYRSAMITRTFGPVAQPVPVIGQGTWHLEGDAPDAASQALRRGLDLGMTHVDTAELYGSGKVEALVGKAIAGRRQEVFLVSKVMPSNASREGTVRACERSLRLLGTDYLDCYLLHWRGEHPLSGTIEALERLREQGKIRSYGVSNFDADDLTEALEIAGPGRIACNQVLYNLSERGIEHAVLPFCEAHGIAVVGYTPFGNAAFPPRGAGAEVLARIAARLAVTPRQVALAFLTRRPSLFAIPKSGKQEHTRENASAGALVLGEAELAEIDRAFPLGPRRRGIAML